MKSKIHRHGRYIIWVEQFPFLKPGHIVRLQPVATILTAISFASINWSTTATFPNMVSRRWTHDCLFLLRHSEWRDNTSFSGYTSYCEIVWWINKTRQDDLWQQPPLQIQKRSLFACRVIYIAVNSTAMGVCAIMTRGFGKSRCTTTIERTLQLFVRSVRNTMLTDYAHSRHALGFGEHIDIRAKQ